MIFNMTVNCADSNNEIQINGGANMSEQMQEQGNVFDIDALIKRKWKQPESMQLATNEVNIAMDVGSTSERSILFSSDISEVSEVFTYDAGFTYASRDIRSYRSQGVGIEHGLLIDIEPNNPAHLIGKKVEIIKGPLKTAIAEVFNPMASNTSKTEQAMMYINILANIGMILLAKMLRDDIVYKNNRVKLTVSLPTEDLESQERVDQFRQRLCGKYTLTFPRLLNTPFEVIISDSDLLVASEIEGTMYYYFSEHDRNEDDTIFFIEGGGRNTSYSCIKNGIISKDAALSKNIGGKLMLSELSRQIGSKLKITAPRVDILERVIDTGYFKQGSKVIDVLDCIDSAKEYYARLVYGGLLQAIDIAGISATEVAKIVCNGRVFKTIVRDGKTVSESVMDKVQRMFLDNSANTEFEYTGVDYPIPQGLLAIRIEEEVFGG